jgi:hypothetical protein
MAFARLSGKSFSEFAKGMEEKKLREDAEKDATNDKLKLEGGDIILEGGDTLNILKDGVGPIDVTKA